MGNKNFSHNSIGSLPPSSNIKKVNNYFNKNKPFESEEPNEVIDRNSFEFINIIGKGGFGKVWKVFHKKRKNYFALKEMDKSKIIDKQSESSIIYERNLLEKLNHP